MELCPKCNKPVQNDDKYCGSCGFKLDFNMINPYATQQDIRVNDVRLNLAMVYFKMYRYDDALNALSHILEAEPSNIQARNMSVLIKKEKNAKEL